MPHLKLPQIMGNGIAGEIAELGPNADGVKIGERVGW